MVSASRPIGISELTRVLDATQRWRIDWLGNVRAPVSPQLQHMITVFFSPLQPGYSGPMNLPAAVIPDAQVAVPLGVGYLPTLHIGALFSNGFKVAVPSQPSQRIKLRISPGDYQFRRMSEPIDPSGRNSRRVVERHEFTVGRAYSHAAPSQVLLVADEDCTDPFFVSIPCIEVARFFFCASSLLSRHLFSSAWSDLIAWDRCDTSALPDHVVVGFNQVRGLTKEYAVPLGYAVADHATQECLIGFQQFLQTERGDGLNAEALECRIPLNSPVEIEAEVVRVRANTPKGFRYFVTRLLSCERPAPFRHCYYWPHMHPGSGTNSSDPDLEPMAVTRGKRDAHLGGPETVAPVIKNLEELANNALAGDHQGHPLSSFEQADYLLDETRFPGPKINCELAPKELQKYRNVGKASRILPRDGVGTSTGRPGGSKDVATAELSTNSRFEDDALKMLRESIPFLEAKGFAVTQLPPIQLLQFSPRSHGRRSQWTQVGAGANFKGEATRRSRLLVALLVVGRSGSCLVGEIERDIPHSRLLADSGDRYALAGFKLESPMHAQEVLQAIARVVADRKGWPAHDSAQQTFSMPINKYSSYQHPGRRSLHSNIRTPQDLAERILTSILDRLEIFRYREHYQVLAPAN